MATDTAVRPDTTDMLAIHNAFRRNLGDAPTHIESARDGERVELIRNFYDSLLGLLHVHHTAEDELVYPVLVERAPGKADTVLRVGAQHRDVDGAVKNAHDRLEEWQLDDASTGQKVAEALVALGRALDEHLSDEERVVLPVAAEHMFVDEWSALPGHAMRTYPGDKIWLALGLVRENMTQEQRDAMLAGMPPPLVEMWTSMGLRAFTELVAEIREPRAQRN